MSDRYGYWRNTILAGKLFIVCKSGHDMREQNIQYCTHNKRTQYTDRHIPFWIFSFLCSSRYSIKSNVSKEKNSSCANHSAKSKLAKGSFIFWNVRHIVF